MKIKVADVRTPYYAMNLNDRKVFAAGRFETIQHAICFFNSYFDGDRYDLVKMIDESFMNMFEYSPKKSASITDYADEFLKKNFKASKTYYAPIGSIICTKLCTKESMSSTKKTKV